MITKGQVYEKKVYVELIDTRVIQFRNLPNDVLETSMIDKKIKNYINLNKIESLLVTNAEELIHFDKTNDPYLIRFWIKAKTSNPVVADAIANIVSEYVVDGLVYSYYVDEAFFQEKLVFSALLNLNESLKLDSSISLRQREDMMTMGGIDLNAIDASSKLISIFPKHQKNSKTDAQLVHQLLEPLHAEKEVCAVKINEEQVLQLINYLKEVRVLLEHTKSGHDVIDGLALIQKRYLNIKLLNAA